MYHYCTLGPVLKPFYNNNNNSFGFTGMSKRSYTYVALLKGNGKGLAMVVGKICPKCPMLDQSSVTDYLVHIQLATWLRYAR